MSLKTTIIIIAILVFGHFIVVGVILYLKIFRKKGDKK